MRMVERCPLDIDLSAAPNVAARVALFLAGSLPDRAAVIELVLQLLCAADREPPDFHRIQWHLCDIFGIPLLLDELGEGAAAIDAGMESLVYMGTDLFPADHSADMLTLLHQSNTSVAALLKAERELFSAAGSRITAGVEGPIRMFQCWWRGRMVGSFSAQQEVLYWRIAHSPRETRFEEIQALSSSCRVHDIHTKHRARRWYVACTCALNDLCAQCEAYREKLGSKCSSETRGAQYVDGQLNILPSGGLRAMSKVTANDIRPRWGAPFKAQPPYFFGRHHTGVFKHLHRLRIPRDMACGYGTNLCEHTVRDSTGRPVLNADGSVKRKVPFAVNSEWLKQQAVVGMVSAWYHLSCALLRLFWPEALVFTPYGNPGGHTMGVLEAGFNASLLDRETQDAFRFFHKLAPDLFGASFPTAVVTTGDALNPVKRQFAREAHPSATEVVATYSTPPCTPGCTLNGFNAEEDPREQKGDRPPARGYRGRAGAMA